MCTKCQNCKCIKSVVQDEKHALKMYLDSMQCAINKAISGSMCEDGYFVEKLRKTAGCMGFTLTPIDRNKPAQ